MPNSPSRTIRSFDLSSSIAAVNLALKSFVSSRGNNSSSLFVRLSFRMAAFSADSLASLCHQRSFSSASKLFTVSIILLDSRIVLVVVGGENQNEVSRSFFASRNASGRRPDRTFCGTRTTSSAMVRRARGEVEQTIGFAGWKDGGDGR